MSLSFNNVKNLEVLEKFRLIEQRVLYKLEPVVFFAFHMANNVLLYLCLLVDISFSIF